MTLYVGPVSPCTGRVADATGLRDGEMVANLVANSQAQLWVAAANLELPESREMGQGTPRDRYIITAFERNQAINRLGAEPVDAATLYHLQGTRTAGAR